MNKDVLKAKEEIASRVSEEMKTSAAALVVEYRGLTVAQISELRKKLREQKATLEVIKNTLISRAATMAGYTGLDAELEGPNALVLAKEDVCGAAKVLAKFARQNEALVLKGGVVDGKTVGADQVKELAKLPGREGLLSMFASCLNASVIKFACTIKALADSKAA